jgi:hypothetical protein
LRKLGILVLGLLLLFSLTACGGGEEKASGDSKVTELTVWNDWTENRPEYKVYKDIIAKFALIPPPMTDYLRIVNVLQIINPNCRDELIAKINEKLYSILARVDLAKIKPEIVAYKYRQNANLLGAVYGAMYTE